MKTVRVVEYIDLEGENHTDEFEESADAVKFFMRITSEKLVKRAALYDKVIENYLVPQRGISCKIQIFLKELKL